MSRAIVAAGPIDSTGAVAARVRPRILCGVTHLAVSIPVRDATGAAAQAAIAAERGATLVEYRIDRMDDADAVRNLVQRSPLPCVVTCRPTWEGGACETAEADRLALLTAAAEAGAAYVDVELAADRHHPGFLDAIHLRAGDTRLIFSSHDFLSRPDDLQRRVRTMTEDDRCAVVKIAWRARSLRDNLEAFELTEQRAKPTIALCMDEAGLPSRVLAKKFGALLTFAGLDDDSGTAPGQVGVETLKRLYRWDAIGPRTRVYGVIGHPVGHSLSPHLHNAGFEATGFDGVYLPMAIPPEYEHFKATVGSWLDHAPLHFRGASVTIPHKENLLRFVRDSGGTIEPLAERIGAANTLTVQEDGALHAANTDYAAALDAVCAALSISREQLAGRRIAVLGAGGAARAIVAGFAHHGAHVTIHNRTADKARVLAEAFADEPGAVETAGPDQLAEAEADVIVNATPLGMHPHTDATPVPQWPAAVGPETVVFDTIYNPARTRLLVEAESRGAKTVSGIEMFVRQAAAQFESWTSQTAPTAVFERLVRERLGA